MFLPALILGLSAGLAPGPLLTLVISETLQHGLKAGIKVAAAPLLTDGPIILISMLILSKIPDTYLFLGVLSILGALFVVYLGIESIMIREVSLDVDQSDAALLRKGALTNALSPHPYIFWFAVGGPYMMRGLSEGIIQPLIFAVTFLGCLVGSKIIIAWVTEKSRGFIQSRYYVYIVRLLGILLLIFAANLLQDGIELLW